MYKRQNTSVAYQAPEGKSYVADLRQVYDFYTGLPKMGIEYDPNNPLSLFEKTILQDVQLEKSHPDPSFSTPMTSNVGIHPAFTGFPGFGSHFSTVQQPSPMSNGIFPGFPSFNPLPPTNFNPFPSYQSSVGHSPSTIDSGVPSPQGSIFNDSGDQISPRKSSEISGGSPDPTRSLDNSKHFEDSRTTGNSVSDVKTEPKIEGVLEYKPKFDRPVLKR